MGLLQDATLQYHSQPEWVQATLRVCAIVVVGGLVISLLQRYAHRVTSRIPRMDRTLDSFIQKVISLSGWALVFVMALGSAGVDVRALLGGLAIGGFILGFALKDTLGNLAAGMMLLFYRPFNIGDWVTVQGKDGEVSALGIALTTLHSADGRIITIPNGSILSTEIVNHTRAPRRRADVVVGIDYEDDIDTAVRAILQALADEPRVLKDPAAGVRILSLGDSSVQLHVRPWVRTGDFWQAQADLHGIVKRAVEGAGCTIPFPQRVVQERPARA